MTMRKGRAALVACLVVGGALALVGCGPDYQLGVTPGGGGGSSGGGGSGGGGGGGGGGSGRDNPWGHLDPGNLPEAYFAVAWYDTETYYYQGGCWDEAMSSEWCGCAPLRYSIVDLRGHVLGTLEPPRPPGWTEDEYCGGGDLRALMPAGPGQFLAVNWQYWGWYGDCYDDDGLNWGNTDWVAWRGDGVTLDANPVARGAWDEFGYYTHLIEADVQVPMPWTSYVNLGMQPTTPQELLHWYGDGYCNAGGLHSLQALDTVDATVPSVEWAPEELLPAWLIESGQVLNPFTLRTGTDLDGTESLLLGVTATSCEGGPSTWWIGAWTELAGLSWSVPLDDLVWPYHVRYSGLDGGSALYLPAVDYEEPLRWRVLRRGSPVDGLLDRDTHLNLRPGPLLDPAGPSFVVLAMSEDGLGDEMVFLHQGQEVWRIKGLKFGLDRRTVPIADVVLLPPVPED
ncbi:MAG: hypothetical protein JRI25_04940 [Deltaproteobacteria bacterium]|nr:hypothetical protein [Deltaproteobacteria bacterium]MBW2253927.1 hypothetical protein [Deltaproteobacteria bacterium]